jgi:hypothetical protein
METTLTLDALSAALAARVSPVTRFGRYTTQLVYRVGHANTQNTRRGAHGKHGHLLVCELVLAEAGDHKAGTLKVGDYASISSCTNNGQYNGRVIAGADLDQVTCSKCVKRLAAIVALDTK